MVRTFGYRTFFFVEGSIKHLISAMVLVAYKDQEGFPVSDDLTLFSSKEAAIAHLTADFEAGMGVYTFFETVEGTGKWFANRRGERSELLPRPPRT